MALGDGPKYIRRGFIYAVIGIGIAWVDGRSVGLIFGGLILFGGVCGLILGGIELSQERKCPSCKKDVHASESFCSSCGQNLR